MPPYAQSTKPPSEPRLIKVRAQTETFIPPIRDRERDAVPFAPITDVRGRSLSQGFLFFFPGSSVDPRTCPISYLRLDLKLNCEINAEFISDGAAQLLMWVFNTRFFLRLAIFCTNAIKTWKTINLITTTFLFFRKNTQTSRIWQYSCVFAWKDSQNKAFFFFWWNFKEDIVFIMLRIPIRTTREWSFR